MAVIAVVSILLCLAVRTTASDTGTATGPRTASRTAEAVRRLMQQPPTRRESSVIRLDEPQRPHRAVTETLRRLQDNNGTVPFDDESSESDVACYRSTVSAQNNRYCSVPDTPRPDTFLILACPEYDPELQNYHDCDCTIGLGRPQDAFNTSTCFKCGFCVDGSLAYDCRNIAEGSCIGVNCNGDCISSTDKELELDVDRQEDFVDDSGAASIAWCTVAAVVVSHALLSLA